MIPVVDMLDLKPYVGQRSATFRFELLDGVTGEPKGDVHPIEGTSPTLTHDTTRTIKRELRGITFAPDDAELVNPLRDRLDVFMVVGGQDFPLGRYVFSDDTSAVYTSGNIMNTMLLDEMYIVDQQIENSITTTNSHHADQVYVSAMTLMQEILEKLDIDFDMAVSPFATTGSWPIGTNRGNVIEDVALDGDWFSPWFANDKKMHFIRTFDPINAEVDFDWDTNKVVVANSIAKTSDLLSAPNRFIVISNSTSDETQVATAIVGIYNVPDSAPWSVVNRGFVIPNVSTRAINNPVQATTVAAALGQRQTIFERYELDTAPDPRHDSYNVIKWQGDKWLELGWTLPLIEGAPMHHVLRKAYR